MKSTTKSDKAPTQVKTKNSPTSTKKEETKKGDPDDKFGKPNTPVKTPDPVPEGSIEPKQQPT